MALYFYIADGETLAPVMMHGKLTAGTYYAEADSILFMGSAQLAFYPPADTDYTLVVSATGYQTKTFTGRTPTTGEVSRDIYVYPTAAPTPAPSGETVYGTVGTSCELVTKQIFGRNWSAYRNKYTNYHSSWYEYADDTQHFAEGNPDCFVVPEAEPSPTAPGNVIEAIGQQVSASTSTITNTLTTVKNTIVGEINSVVAGADSIISMLQSILSRLDILPSIKTWQTTFAFPDWQDVIIHPISNLLQPMRDILAWTKTFELPDWDTTIVQPINSLLQPMRDVKTMLTDFLTFAWFTQLVMKIENMLDVWFSSKLGIDPAKPFWDEVENRIITIVVNNIHAILNRTIPEPPSEEE